MALSYESLESYLLDPERYLPLAFAPGVLPNNHPLLGNIETTERLAERLQAQYGGSVETRFGQQEAEISYTLAIPSVNVSSDPNADEGASWRRQRIVTHISGSGIDSIKTIDEDPSAHGFALPHTQWNFTSDSEPARLPFTGKQITYRQSLAQASFGHGGEMVPTSRVQYDLTPEEQTGGGFGRNHFYEEVTNEQLRLINSLFPASVQIDRGAIVQHARELSEAGSGGIYVGTTDEQGRTAMVLQVVDAGYVQTLKVIVGARGELLSYYHGGMPILPLPYDASGPFAGDDTITKFSYDGEGRLVEQRSRDNTHAVAYYPNTRVDERVVAYTHGSVPLPGLADEGIAVINVRQTDASAGELITELSFDFTRDVLEAPELQPDRITLSPTLVARYVRDQAVRRPNGTMSRVGEQKQVDYTFERVVRLRAETSREIVLRMLIVDDHGRLACQVTAATWQDIEPAQ